MSPYLPLPTRRGEAGTVGDVLVLLVVLAVIGGIGFGVWKVFIAEPAPKQHTETVDSPGDLVDGCGRARHFFAGNRPYTGKGPHPIAVFEIRDGETRFHQPVFTEKGVPAHWWPRQAGQVRLIACADQSGTGNTIKTCHFDNPVMDVPMRRADYKVRVFEASTGREVGDVEIKNGERATCPFIEFYREGDDPEVYTSLSLAQYRDALAQFVDRPAT